MPKLTRSFIERLHARESKRSIIRDSDLPGFGVRVNSKTKSWVVEKRVAGVNRRITIGTYPVMTPDDARLLARQILNDISMGVDPVAKKENERIANLTLAQVLDAFLQSRELKPQTIFTYRSVIERHLSDWLDLPVRQITRDMCEQRHKAIPGPTRCKTDGKTRANCAFQCLRNILRWASDKFLVDGKPLLDANPVSRLTKNRQWYPSNVRQGTIPDHRLAEFYRLVMKQPKLVRDYILLLLFTGLRRTEAAKLMWKHIDFEARTLTIPAGFNKSKRDHILPMSGIVYAILQSRQEPESLYVFPGRYSGHLNEPRAPLAHLRAQMGWNWMFHDLRRTALSAGEKLGVPFLALQKIANHCVRREVTDRYLVLDVEFLRPLMQNISARLLEQMQTSVEQWKLADAGVAPVVSAAPAPVKVENVVVLELAQPVQEIVSIVIVEAEVEEVYF